PKHRCLSLMLAAYGNCIDVTELFMKCTTTVLHSKACQSCGKKMAAADGGGGGFIKSGTPA
ncbi:hypothetical protein L3W99_19275, partial [Escherichia coli]|uniref:hypothetical protein n=1 Tax=Escherichia coli TaxID=562 RepID=UPI001F1D8A2A